MVVGVSVAVGGIVFVGVLVGSFVLVGIVVDVLVGPDVLVGALVLVAVAGRLVAVAVWVDVVVGPVVVDVGVALVTAVDVAVSFVGVVVPRGVVGVPTLLVGVAERVVVAVSVGAFVPRVGALVSVGVWATRVCVVVVLVLVGAFGPRVGVSVVLSIRDVAVGAVPALLVALGSIATAVLITGRMVGRTGRGVTVGASSSKTFIGVDVGALRGGGTRGTSAVGNEPTIPRVGILVCACAVAVTRSAAIAWGNSSGTAAISSNILHGE